VGLGSNRCRNFDGTHSLIRRPFIGAHRLGLSSISAILSPPQDLYLEIAVTAYAVSLMAILGIKL
jgi:hypothetical protein